MNESNRDQLIDSYLNGMDHEDKELLRDAFAPDIVHVRVLPQNDFATLS